MTYTEWVLIALVIVAVIVTFIVYEKSKHPTAGAMIGTDVAAAGHAIAIEVSSLRTTIEGWVAKTAPATPVVPAPTPAPVVPGKNGQAGPLTFQATGDPKIDFPAFNAQYFG